MVRPGAGNAGRNAAEAGLAAVMAHHRAAWRVERIGWSVIALLLAAAMFGAFGDGPLSHAKSGSDRARVEYERLLRANAPTSYRFRLQPSGTADGVVHLRIDQALVDLMELESIMPAPELQTVGAGYTEFSFRAAPREGVPLDITFRFRPATFGRFTGRVQMPGSAPLRIGHFVFP